MKKIAFISDLIFTFCVSFLFTACFFRFLRLSLVAALALSALCATLVTCAMAAWLNARRKKFFLKKADAEAKEKLLTHLALLPDDKLTDYFFDYFTILSAQPQADCAPKQRGNLQLSAGDKVYFLHFRFAPATPDTVAEVFRTETEQTKVLLCGSIDTQAQALCKKWNIQTRTGDEVYAALKQANALPAVYLGDTGKQPKPKLKLWFAKRNARRYLTSAALIFLLAQLTPFFLYYLIFSVLLLLTAILVRVLGYE